MSFYLPIKPHFAHSFLSSMASNTRTRIKIPVSTYFIRRSHVTGIAIIIAQHCTFCFVFGQQNCIIFHKSQIIYIKQVDYNSLPVPYYQYRITSTAFHHKAKHID